MLSLRFRFSSFATHNHLTHSSSRRLLLLFPSQRHTLSSNSSRNLCCCSVNPIKQNGVFSVANNSLQSSSSFPKDSPFSGTQLISRTISLKNVVFVTLTYTPLHNNNSNNLLQSDLAMCFFFSGLEDVFVSYLFGKKRATDIAHMYVLSELVPFLILYLEVLLFFTLKFQLAFPFFWLVFRG